VDYRPERKLSDYLGLAGGPTERAWLSEAQLIRRDGQQIRLDLTGLRQPGFSLPEVVLAPGDTLSLPENVQKVYVQGEVRQPGAFDYRPGLTVADYLGLAGGPTPTAWLREARLRKAGGPQEQILDLDRPRDLVDAVMVGPGDVLSVPTKWHRVNVVGEVSKPGAIPWREGARLLDYLGEAGGVTENAWLNQATLTSAAAGDAAAEVRTVDLAALLHGAKPEDNLVLQPGDTLSVSPKLQNVYVLGEVVNPGAYEYRPGQTVADYLGLAGGPTPEALRSQATLTREVEGTRTVTTFSLEESEKDHLSLVLSPSDTIYLPRNVLKVNVVGEVHRPGEFEFRKGLRLSDYVAQAGGPTDLAKTSEVRIARGQGQDRQVFKVDLGKALKGKDPESNPELQAGDTVTVPQRAIARWTEVTNLLDVFFRFGLLWWLRR
jgi:protein involved in polysaccharide export with SLBB domain